MKKKIVTPFVVPMFITSENDAKLNIALVKDSSKSNGINWKLTSTYNPRANAKVEQMVVTLVWAVKNMVLSSNKQWDECIDGVLGGYRRRPRPD